MLEHHTNAHLASVRGVFYFQWQAIPQQFAFVWLHQTIDHLHQGTFASAIFTQQGMNFGWGDSQVNIVIGQTARVLFGDATQAEPGWYRLIGHGLFLSAEGSGVDLPVAVLLWILTQ